MENENYEVKLHLLNMLLTHDDKVCKMAKELYDKLSESSRRKFFSQDTSETKYSDEDGYCYYLPEKFYADKNIRAYICFGDCYPADSFKFPIGKGDSEKVLEISLYGTGDRVVEDLHEDSPHCTKNVFQNYRDVIKDFEKQNGRIEYSAAYITYEGRKNLMAQLQFIPFILLSF